MGDLGRHTEIGTKEVRGRVFPIPILTHRTKVFQQVRLALKAKTYWNNWLINNQAVYATGLSQVLTFGFTKLAVLLFYQR